MKILLALLLVPLLASCAAWGNFSDELFGANTKKTIKWCDNDGDCTKVTIDGDQTDAAQLLSIAAQLYGVEVTEDE